MKKTIKKLSLNKEKITELTKQEARALNGGKVFWVTTGTVGFTHKTVHGDTKQLEANAMVGRAPEAKVNNRY